MNQDITYRLHALICIVWTINLMDGLMDLFLDSSHMIIKVLINKDKKDTNYSTDNNNQLSSASHYSQRPGLSPLLYR